jgi:hypothetical protein
MPTEPSAGAPRREGRGFISSFGAGRTCAVADCPTILSRYNERTRCSVHDQSGRETH